MKENNWFHNKISQNPDCVKLGAILLFCLLYRVFYFGVLHPGMVLYNSDSVSYFAFVDIFRGIVDLYHTPFYPYVIKLFEYISRDNLVQNLIFFQQVISFLSVIPFYFISKSIVKNRYLIIIATLFYGVWHPILIQNVHLNPESLCFAGSTLMLFILVKYLEKPKKLTALSIGIFPLFLIMLKPTYLILILVVLLFFVFRFVIVREERKNLYWGLLGLFFCASGVMGYCEMNNRHNGQFVLSNIYLNNSIAHISQSGAYRYGDDEELIAIVDATRHLGYYMAPFIINNDVMDKYSVYYKRFPQYLPPTDDMLFCMNMPDRENYSPERIKRFIRNSQLTAVYGKYMLGRVIDIIFAYGNLFVLFVLQSTFIIVAFVKYKKIAWAQSFCILFVLGQFFSITIGGLDDIDRCLIPAYPFIIQIAASLLAILISFLKKEKIVELIL
jgi:hypothetical protein